MTLLGKIFTVCIFVMSILFMAFSVVVFATHKNWKLYVTNPPEAANSEYGVGLIHQKKALEETIAGLQDRIDELNNQMAMEQAARRHAIGALETKLADTQQRLTDKESELRALQSAEGEAATAALVAQQTVEALRSEVKQLRDDIRVARQARDDQFLAVVTLTDQLHAATGVQRALQERQVQLIDQLTDYKKVLDAYGLKPEMDISGVAPPLDGIVTAVGERNLIEVSLGSDDGLRIGHRLEVFRDNTYLGHAIVLKTDPDRAVAEIDEKTQKGLVKVQDRVATRLNRQTTG